MKGFKNTTLISKILIKSNQIFRVSKLFYIYLFINVFFLFGCSSLKQNDEVSICLNSILPCLDSTEYVLLLTNKGSIKLELYGKLAPLTVGSFVDFVERGLYDNTIFDRVIRQPYPFIIRGGYNKLKKDDDKFLDIKTGKIRYIPLEIKLNTNKLPTYCKKIDTSNKKNNIELKHKRASVSMARSLELNSANLQFYISLKSLPELDGRFAVFGKVISGMNVVDLIQEDDFIVKASRLKS